MRLRLEIAEIERACREMVERACPGSEVVIAQRTIYGIIEAEITMQGVTPAAPEMPMALPPPLGVPVAIPEDSPL